MGVKVKVANWVKITISMLILFFILWTINNSYAYINAMVPCNNCDKNGKISVECKVCKGKGIQQSKQCSDCNGLGKISDKCGECNGSKVIKCPNCSGEGIVKCEKCNGEGKITDYSKKTCVKCNGKGKIQGIFGGEKDCSACNSMKIVDATCPYCNGRCMVESKIWGKYSCTECNGTGKVQQGSYVMSNCNSCQCKGKVFCNKCNNIKKLLCEKCNGKGYSEPRVCPKCNGNKNIDIQCESCKGSKTKTVTCSYCSGTKKVARYSNWF